MENSDFKSNCTDNEGLYIGCDTYIKPFSKSNENSFCMGILGHGMSFVANMEMIKDLKEGNNGIVFDPKSEYSMGG